MTWTVDLGEDRSPDARRTRAHGCHPNGEGSPLRCDVVYLATRLRGGRATMGEGIGGLIDEELGALVDEGEHRRSVFAAEMERGLVVRSEAFDIRERRLDEREESLRASERLLRARTRSLEVPSRSSAGRNDPCPCGSGFKYKRCHGN